MNELINYKNGLAEGFRYHFYENGTVKDKVFYLKDSALGDAYFFDKNKNIIGYHFYDWESLNINSITYDIKGNISEDFRQAIFIDSLQLFYDSLQRKPSYDLLLVISNPAHCKSVIKIDYFSVKNILTKSDSVSNKQYYLKKELLPDSLSFINIIGSQYDSLKRKTLFQKKKLNFKY